MIKAVRKIFGINQQFLADYLCISRSQVSMVEKGERLSVGPKNMLMLEFHKILSIKPPSANAHKKIASLLAQQEEERKEVIESQLVSTKLNLQNARKKLANMQAEYQRSLSVLEKMDQLKSVGQTEGRSFLNVVELENAEVFKHNRPAIQWQVQTEIHLLQAKLDFLNNEIGQ